MPRECSRHPYFAEGRWPLWRPIKNAVGHPHVSAHRESSRAEVVTRVEGRAFCFLICVVVNDNPTSKHLYRVTNHHLLRAISIEELTFLDHFPARDVDISLSSLGSI